MNKHKIFISISLVLIFFVMFISIGYASLSTSLSINGKAAFRPVDMIRVMSITPLQMNNADDIKTSYDTNSISALIDIDDLSGSATYKVNITNLGQKDKVLSKILNDVFSNEDMEYEVVGLKEGDVIKKSESVDFKIVFKYKKEISEINITRLNAKIKFLFDDYIDISTDNEIEFDDDGDITLLNYKGDCRFNGKNNNITGVCANSTDRDFINTGIKLFNEKNYRRNFVLSFTIKDVDDSRFSAGKRDTIVSALYEQSDNIKGKFPGIVLRIEGNKWQLQAGNGRVAGTKLQFAKDDLLNKKLTIIRYTSDNVTNVYYMIDNTGPFLLANITNLYANFDTPLSIGANLQIDNTTPDRFATATLENFSFKFLDDSYPFNQIVKEEATNNNNDDDDDQPIIFNAKGPCIFNASDNITGDNCLDYLNTNYINSGISLFSKENYKRDFDLSFNIAGFNPLEQNNTQATILNSLIENKDKSYPAIVMRRNKDKIELILRDGVSTDKNITIPNDVNSIRLVRKNNNLCYGINGGSLIYAYNYSKISKTFDLPVTFGSSLDQSGLPWRNIIGTLSNMNIKVGNVDDVICVAN